jgi:hypothetical protein
MMEVFNTVSTTGFGERERERERETELLYDLQCTAN